MVTFDTPTYQPLPIHTLTFSVTTMDQGCVQNLQIAVSTIVRKTRARAIIMKLVWLLNSKKHTRIAKDSKQNYLIERAISISRIQREYKELGLYPMLPRELQRARQGTTVQGLPLSLHHHVQHSGRTYLHTI
jgi:hypothetical protein